MNYRFLPGKLTFASKLTTLLHDDVIKWKHFLRYWPFVWGIHRSHKSQWRGALMFSLICVWINGWVNNGEAGDLRRYHAHYDVTVMVHVIKVTQWTHEVVMTSLLYQHPKPFLDIISLFHITSDLTYKWLVMQGSILSTDALVVWHPSAD